MLLKIAQQKHKDMPGLKARMKTTCLLMKVKAGEGELSVKKLPAVEKGQPQKELDHQV